MGVSGRSPWPRVRAKPKSLSFAQPVAKLRRTFVGVMSRCTNQRQCKASRPLRICRERHFTWASVMVRLLSSITFFRSPSMKSMTRCNEPPSENTSIQPMTLGCWIAFISLISRKAMNPMPPTARSAWDALAFFTATTRPVRMSRALWTLPYVPSPMFASMRSYWAAGDCASARCSQNRCFRTPTFIEEAGDETVRSDAGEAHEDPVEGRRRCGAWAGEATPGCCCCSWCCKGIAAAPAAGAIANASDSVAAGAAELIPARALLAQAKPTHARARARTRAGGEHDLRRP
mmetsp:Transcript_9839/g.25883  ORF Transcript_9839/g.25883 Transcript_9839/m.25883 type:complete len:289 (-) Transcript_9839:17-883(-)